MEHREAQRSERGLADEDDASAGPLGIGTIDPGEVVHAAAETARESPHAALAGAFAIGFLLGGGLTPRLLVSLAVLAGRRYATAAAQEALDAAVRRQIDEVTAH
jgi:hypothetical protein